MNLDRRFKMLAHRIFLRPVLDADLLGAALLEFRRHGVLPTACDLRDAILDIEEAAFLAAGGDPDAAWLRVVDDARRGGVPANDEALRRAAVGVHTGPMGFLAQLDAQRDGIAAIRLPRAKVPG